MEKINIYFKLIVVSLIMIAYSNLGVLLPGGGLSGFYFLFQNRKLDHLLYKFSLYVSAVGNVFLVIFIILIFKESYLYLKRKEKYSFKEKL